MMVPEVGDKETIQELDLLKLDLDDTDFVDFLVAWGDNKKPPIAASVSSSSESPVTTEQKETTTKTHSSKRKNDKVITSGQPQKRSKKSGKGVHQSVQQEVTETAECSAYMAAAGSY